MSYAARRKLRTRYLTAMPLHRRLFLSTLAAVVAAPSSAKPKPAIAAHANALPRTLTVPGGVTRIALGEATDRPVARTGDIPLLVIGSAHAWLAFIGIPLDAAPGPAFITVEAPGSDARTIDYTIRPKKYAEQRLKVEPKHVELSPEDLARFERERAHQLDVMATFSQPVPGPTRWSCARPCPAGAPVHSGCAGYSTASRVRRIRAWTSRRPSARRFAHRWPPV